MQDLEPLKHVYLGNTGLKISQLGLGTVKFGRNTGVKYPHKFELPDDNAIKNLLDLAKELNINLLDTAPAYGTSEERLGKLLKHERHKWIISSKVGEEFNNNHSIFNFSKEYIISSVYRSLKLLNTDYLDLLLIHSDGNDEEIIQRDRVFDTLMLLKQQGIIRSFGMSIKTVAGGLLAVKIADVLMVTYNLNYLDEKIIIDEAYKLNKGILIKKALASGYNAVKPSMKLIFQTPGIHSIIVGTINKSHLIENARYATSNHSRWR